jgi:hypothetical protein
MESEMEVSKQAREKRVDDILAQEQATRDAEARAVIHAKLVEEDRVAREADEYAKQSAARAAFLERAEAAYGKACVEYKAATDAFRESRLRLWALDSILNRSGFSDHHMGVALRHATAAPDEGDLHHDFGATVISIRKTLGG